MDQARPRGVAMTNNNCDDSSACDIHAAGFSQLCALGPGNTSIMGVTKLHHPAVDRKASFVLALALASRARGHGRQSGPLQVISLSVPNGSGTRMQGRIPGPQWQEQWRHMDRSDARHRKTQESDWYYRMRSVRRRKKATSQDSEKQRDRSRGKRAQR